MKLAQITILACLFAVSATAAEKPKCEIRNVRISSPRLAVSRSRGSSSAAVATGQFGVEMSFARATVKKPVMRVVALCETGGALSIHAIFLDTPNSCNGMKRADIMRAFKDNGIDIPQKEREAAYSDPVRFTPLLPEVTKGAYAKTVYGTSETNKGFFRLGRSTTMPKIIIWRIEVWQNGFLADSWESSKNGLGKYELPGDWYEWKKYPAKFKYVAAH